MHISWKYIYHPDMDGRLPEIIAFLDNIAHEPPISKPIDLDYHRIV